MLKYKLDITKWQIYYAVGKTLFVEVCWCVYMWIYVYVYVYICVHYYKEFWQNIMNWDFKQIIINDSWVHNYQQRKFRNGGEWNLISSTGEPEQKWLYWNPKNSRPGHQLMGPTTWVTIFNWSPYLQLWKKLNHSSFTIFTF